MGLIFSLLNDLRLRAELLLKFRKAVAVAAHEVRAPLPAVACVALHRSHVGAVRVRFYVRCLLRERLITPAVAGDALFLRGVPLDARLRVLLGERLCRGTGGRGEEGDQSECDEFLDFLFPLSYSAVLAQAAAWRPAIDPNTAFAVWGFSPRSPDAAHSPTA